MMTRARWGSVWLSVAAAIWGSMFVVSKIVLATVPPLTLVWMRYVIAIVVLLGFMTGNKHAWYLSKRDWSRVALIGVIGYVLSITAQFIGTKLATAQLGSLITASTPAFMIIFAHYLLRERATRVKIMALVMALAGVLLIVGLGTQDASMRWGEGILGLAAVSWAWMSVLVKTLPSRYSSITVTFYAMVLAALLMTPVAFWQMPWPRMTAVIGPRPELLWDIGYLGVVSTGVAFFLWNLGLKRVEAGLAGFYLFFQPVVGGILGWLVLNEHFTWSFALGAVLIVVAVILAISGGARHYQAKPGDSSSHGQPLVQSKGYALARQGEAGGEPDDG